MPPHLPRTMLADLGGAQEVVSAALGLLLARERGQGSQYASVSLAQAAEWYAAPLRHGLTCEGGVLSGRLPGYNLYRAKESWIAVAALEPHFWQTLLRELDKRAATSDDLQTIFLTRTAQEWEEWAAERDIPLVAVREG
jgi:crotonobetainyl-CoA:carnitine CoA-transferase CaiB-like acyl-CoA transferase